MAAKIKRGGHRSPYRLRKQVVEPVIGQIKQAKVFASSCFVESTKSDVSGRWFALLTIF